MTAGQRPSTALAAHSMTAPQIAQMFARFAHQTPEPKTELRYQSPFELLIAVMLSAQATDVSVNKATQQLFPIANTPAQILNLGEETLKTYIASIGLYHTKARHIIATCHQLIAAHDAQVPEQRLALEALPGVGRKTANVVLNTAFGQPTIAVDTHIFRFSNRTGLAISPTVRGVEDQLYRVIPQRYLANAHHWLILHGRYVCQARRPRCLTCNLFDLCAYRQKTRAAPGH